MRISLDLPDTLLKQLQLRAIREGRKLEDLVADVLRENLDAATEGTITQAPSITKDEKTGLPLIICKHQASPREELTPERVADILLAQEVVWHDQA